MPAKSIVFVLGAGASNGVGYPVGVDLKRNIKNKLLLPETNPMSYPIGSGCSSLTWSASDSGPSFSTRWSATNSISPFSMVNEN